MGTTTTSVQPIPRTPWGAAQHIEPVIPGVFWVSTAGHGGYYVEPRLLANRFDAKTLAETWGGLGQRGWFEEDCDACLVPLAFAREWPDPQQVEDARTYRAMILNYRQTRDGKYESP